jgi:hypothetical protein
MKFALLTTDPVNAHVARKHADGALDVLFPKDPPPDGRYDAVIYDLDHWDPARRQAVLHGLLNNPPRRKVAVVSYQLRPKEVRGLRRRKVGVFKRVGPRLFRALRTPAAAPQPSTA